MAVVRRASNSAVLLCFCTTLFVGTGAVAQAPAPDQPFIEVPETLKLSRFVDLAAEFSGRRYNYVPSELDAITVTLRGMKSIPVADLPEVLDQVLAGHRYTTVRTPDSVIFTVTKLDAAAGLSRVYEDGLPDAGYGTIMVSARHRSAADLAEAVRPLLSGGNAGKVEPVGKTGYLLISDTTPRLESIRAFVGRIDTPDLNAVHIVPLRSAAAGEVASSANAVAAKRADGPGRRLQGEVMVAPAGRALILIAPPESERAWRSLIASFDSADTPSTLTYQPRTFAAADVAQLLTAVLQQEGDAGGGAAAGIVVDELTQSLIITATPADHGRVRALLERLDSQDRVSRTIRSFAVKNRPVRDLLGTLRQLVSSGALGEAQGAVAPATADEVARGALQRHPRPAPPPPGSAGLPRAGAIDAGEMTAAVVPAEGAWQEPGVDGLSLTADEATNTLIAIGEPRLLVQVEKLLQTLDVRQPQVMLEVVLVTLTDTQTLTFGAELDRISSLGNSAIRLSSLFGLGTAATGVPPPSVGAGFTGAVLNPGEFSLVVRALETINAGNSVSRPQVLVSNNEQAQFSSTIQQPVRQLTRSNTSDQTFSYGGTESAGTTISVKPQIAQGDHLVLTYAVNLSSFIGTSADPGIPPPKQDNSVRSVATIPDGHVVVVGGLELLNSSDARSRLPVIGRIPVLGQLLGTTSDTSGRTRFFVFIKAAVLRSATFEDLKYISASGAARMGVDDGFPEVHPRVIR